MDAKTADEALGQLLSYIAERRSLLPWTMTWCPDGDANWEAIWTSATNTKSMLNALVAAGSVRGARVKSAPYVVGSPRGESVVQLVIECADGRIVERSARVDELARVVRAEIPRPPLDRIIATVHAGV